MGRGAGLLEAPLLCTYLTYDSYPFLHRVLISSQDFVYDIGPS